MKKTIATVLLLLAPALSCAVTEVKLQKADIDIHDQASLQRGAKLFVNYCLSCHSASYMRYNRMADDLGLTEKEVKENLMFATDKIGNPMKVSMPSADARRWFGVPPPDLSVIARARGVDWLYSYLLGFYVDDNPARPFGVNNLVFKDVGMPNVLWELQGTQVPVYKEVSHSEEKVKVIDGLELQHPGLMNEEEFRSAITDLVTFLAYTSEPAKLQRLALGPWVLGFLVLFTIIAYLLKKEYWRDVH